jgi:hypothetical protein
VLHALQKPLACTPVLLQCTSHTDPTSHMCACAAVAAPFPQVLHTVTAMFDDSATGSRQGTSTLDIFVTGPNCPAVPEGFGLLVSTATVQG